MGWVLGQAGDPACGARRTDLVQMDEKYLLEYVQRGALASLKGAVDTLVRPWHSGARRGGRRALRH